MPVNDGSVMNILRFCQKLYLTPEQFAEAEKHQLPPVSASHVIGVSLLCLNSAEAMEQSFIKYAKQTTKNKTKRDSAKLLLGDSIFFKLTEDDDFNQRRKALSSSLFKNKIRKMMEDIKEVTMEHIGEYKE